MEKRKGKRKGNPLPLFSLFCWQKKGEVGANCLDLHFLFFCVFSRPRRDPFSPFILRPAVTQKTIIMIPPPRLFLPPPAITHSHNSGAALEYEEGKVKGYNTFRKIFLPLYVFTYQDGKFLLNKSLRYATRESCFRRILRRIPHIEGDLDRRGIGLFPLSMLHFFFRRRSGGAAFTQMVREGFRVMRCGLGWGARSSWRIQAAAELLGGGDGNKEEEEKVYMPSKVKGVRLFL